MKKMMKKMMMILLLLPVWVWGQGTFVAQTDWLEISESAQAVAWGDIDQDGDDDLFVANAYGTCNALYRNNGGGSFSLLSASAVCTPVNNSYGGAWGDFDNDGDLDLYVANNGAQNEFYQNDGSGGFTAVNQTIVTEAADASYGASWCDYDNEWIRASQSRTAVQGD